MSSLLLSTALLLQPFFSEALGGVVGQCNQLGFFAFCCPLRIFVSKHSMPEERFDGFDAKQEAYILDDKEVVIAAGAWLRLKVKSRTVEQGNITAIATIKENYLGLADNGESGGRGTTMHHRPRTFNDTTTILATQSGVGQCLIVPLVGQFATARRRDSNCIVWILTTIGRIGIVISSPTFLYQFIIGAAPAGHGGPRILPHKLFSLVGTIGQLRPFCICRNRQICLILILFHQNLSIISY
ncbi:hypothetical protein ACA910_007330 [Epithemia clementina (nom. ined.)]